MQRERSMWVPNSQKKASVLKEYKPDVIYSEEGMSPLDKRVGSSIDVFNNEGLNALDKVTYKESSGFLFNEQDENGQKISNYNTKYAAKNLGSKVPRLDNADLENRRKK